MPGFAPNLPQSSSQQKGKPAKATSGAPTWQVVSPAPQDNRLARQTNLSGMSPKQIQRLLRAQGYDVTVDGKMGPHTQTAMDAYIKGKPPKQYNTWAAKHFKSVVMTGANPKAVAAGGPGQLSGPGGSPAPKVTGGGGGSGVKGGSGGSALLNPNIGDPTPENYATQLADLQYGQDVRDAQRALDAAPAQNDQNLHDIMHWYAQVLDSQNTAASRDAEIGRAGQASVKDTVNSIIASLGGAANEGAGVVGGAGADAAGMLAATGAAQDQYNQDIRPLLQSESAGASTRERARQSQALVAMRAALADAQTKRGGAEAEARLKIRDSNNALAQQAFSNTLGLEQTKIAGMTAGAKLDAAMAKANQPGKGSFAATSPTAKLGIMQTAVGAIFDGQKLTKPIPQAVQLVNSIIAGAGWDRSNPAVMNFRNQILQSVGITPQQGWT